MAVFRVEKTKDFTIMSNHHLRNTELSLKAKGLLSLMLSLPEDWDYTTKGLAHICKDGVDSITTALKELERHGYLTRQRLRYDNGQLGDIEYTIHEQPVSTENTGLSPKRENPRQVKPEQAKPKQAEPEQENPAQLNTNPLKTKKSKKDKSITYPSIYPAEPEAANRTDGMDRIELIEAYREIIKENIEYDLLVLRYPHLFTNTATLQVIRLEIGALAAWTPAKTALIEPYAAKYYPKIFEQKETAILTVAPERTFWEKATILHHEANRPEHLEMPQRYSRHYYDLYRMAATPVKEAAFSRLDLLKKVVDFKMKFYPRAWAKYPEAVPGTLKLLPPEYRFAALETDYNSMQDMLYGDIPTFETVIAAVQELEKEINTL